MRLKPGFQKNLNFINRPKKREIAQFQLRKISSIVRTPTVTSLVGPAVAEHIEEFKSILGDKTVIRMVENCPKVHKTILNNLKEVKDTSNVSLNFADILDLEPTNIIDFDATKTLPVLEQSVRHLIQKQKVLLGTKALIVACSQRHPHGWTKQDTVNLFLQIIREEIKDTCVIAPFTKRATNGNMASLKYSYYNKVQTLDLISYRDGGCPMMAMTLIYK